MCSHGAVTSSGGGGNGEGCRESNRIGLYSCGLVVRTRVPRYMTSLISSTSLRSSIGRIILSWLLVIEIRRYCICWCCKPSFDVGSDMVTKTRTNSLSGID